MPGWGPFVEVSTYQDFILDHIDQPEVNSDLRFQIRKVYPEILHYKTNTCESEHGAIVRLRLKVHLATPSLVWVL